MSNIKATDLQSKVLSFHNKVLNPAKNTLGPQIQVKRDDRGLPIFDFARKLNSELSKDDCPKQDCDVYECEPYFWVPERKLCLYCGHRG